MDCDRSYRASPDEDLVARYLAGDEGAITVLYLRYWHKLFAFGLSRLRDPDDAKDLIQVTWEAVLTWRGLGRIDSAWRFRGHVFRVAAGVVTNWVKHAAVRERARDELERNGGRPVGARCCAYCEAVAHRGELCPAHAKRKRNGATEIEMKKPVRGWTK